jgi:hypothetical protein
MTSKFAGFAFGGVDEPTRMIIRHPVTRQPIRNAETGEEAWIDLLAAKGAVGRAYDRAMTDKFLKLRGQRYTADESDSDVTEKLAKLTKAWSLVLPDGTPVEMECTTANAREFYSFPEAWWLREQVAEFVAELGNFLPASSKS